MLCYNIIHLQQKVRDKLKKSLLPKMVFTALLVAFGISSPSGAVAGSIDVVSSIRPLHALVLAVGDGIITPELLISESSSAHNFTLKASDAKKIEKSDVIFWIGPELERALKKPIATLGSNARVITVMDEPAISLIPYGGTHDGHGHEDEHGGQNDPHVWLSTENALGIIDIIEKALKHADPANGAAYEKNAKVAKNRIRTLKRQIEKFLQPIKDVPFVVQHDGFSYMVKELDLNQRGYITNIKGSEAGARHIAELKKMMAAEKVKCIFTEPQMASQMAKSLSLDSGIKLGELDAMGVGLDESPTLYARIMQKNARALLNCLGSNGAK